MANFQDRFDPIEAQLQQELREMFAIDTQQNLETYFRTIERLNVDNWQSSIQQIYRDIHTIKGGSVTVGAEDLRQLAAALEEILSDLRYLEISPDLSNGKLVDILIEAGELLSSRLNVDLAVDPEATIESSQPSLWRLQELHQQVKETYLQGWHPLRQVHLDFVNQGFDLVVLDLEMAIEAIDNHATISEATHQVAAKTIAQLAEIGTDIELGKGWQILLECGRSTLNIYDGKTWKNLWEILLPSLKECGKNSGELTPELQARWQSIEFTSINSSKQEETGTLLQFDLENDRQNLPSLIIDFDPDPELNSGDLVFFNNIEELGDVENVLLAEALDEFDAVSVDIAADSERENLELPVDFEMGIVDEDNLFSEILIQDTIMISDAFAVEIIDDFKNNLNSGERSDSLDATIGNFLDEPFATNEETVFDFIDEHFTIDETGLDTTALWNELPEMTEELSLLTSSFLTLSQGDDTLPQSHTKPEIVVASIEDIPKPIETVSTPAVETTPKDTSIPVPLSRLNRASGQTIETILAARSANGTSAQLQYQLGRLMAIVRDSNQSIAQLRQLQDDYASLREDTNLPQQVSLERYRKGYGTIQRLLENTLRLTELGREIETATHETIGHLNDVDRHVTSLQETIQTSRMVPFRQMTFRARAIVRDLATRFGKPVKVRVENEEIELDAGIVQQLEPALLHLLRNAYDRGIETPEIRQAAGKPAEGTIEISLRRRGNIYRLCVRDDGGGIDPAAISQRAKERGFTFTNTSNDAEILALISQPGFSSRDEVNDVSGRGVGMDVVATQVAAMGGRLFLENIPGRGVTFLLDIPVPQLLVPCVLLRVGDRTVALPAEDILETRLLDTLTTQPIEDPNSVCTWQITAADLTRPGFDLCHYWQSSDRAADKMSEEAVCLFVRTDKHHQICFLADALLGQVDLPIESLPHPLIPPKGFLGVSLQTNGKLVSVLDPIALAATIAEGNGVAFTNDDEGMPTVASELVLIVDDAALMRRRFEASLNGYGFATVTCNDGLEAWQWIQANGTPSLLITDVEMPVMDGFTLISRVRQAGYQMPILVVSSRVTAEWVNEARRLGADNYLNKGFSTAELMQKVNFFFDKSAVR